MNGGFSVISLKINLLKYSFHFICSFQIFKYLFGEGIVIYLCYFCRRFNIHHTIIIINNFIVLDNYLWLDIAESEELSLMTFND